MNERFTIEPMRESEIAFLLAKYEKDVSSYKRFMNLFMFLALGICIIFMILHEVLPRDENWSKETHPNYYLPIFFLLALFIAIIGWIGFKYSLSKLWRDCEECNKTAEKVVILTKFQDITGQEYFFSLDSIVKPQLSVSHQEFEFYAAGDEINIEYACHSKEFFSYF
jgi:hypothetical protein